MTANDQPAESASAFVARHRDVVIRFAKGDKATTDLIQALQDQADPDNEEVL